MSAGLILIPLLALGVVGLFGPLIAGVYLAAKLNGRR